MFLSNFFAPPCGLSVQTSRCGVKAVNLQWFIPLLMAVSHRLFILRLWSKGTVLPVFQIMFLQALDTAWVPMRHLLLKWHYVLYYNLYNLKTSSLGDSFSNCQKPISLLTLDDLSFWVLQVYSLVIFYFFEFSPYRCYTSLWTHTHWSLCLCWGTNMTISEQNSSFGYKIVYTGAQ